MNLPSFQSADQTFQLLQQKWASIINPFLSNPSNGSSILSAIPLVSGKNVINHKLGRKLQGYRIILKSAGANIYDNQTSNQMPDLTLILVSDVTVTVSIEVF